MKKTYLMPPAWEFAVSLVAVAAAEVFELPSAKITVRVRD